MSLILVYISLAFTAVALVLTVLPLVGTRRERVRVEFIEEELRTIEALASKRAALLQQLRDLEFDRETDKVSEDDYTRFKRRYELNAVAIMRQLDGLRGGQNWDKIVDTEIAAHLESNAPELVDAALPTESRVGATVESENQEHIEDPPGDPIEPEDDESETDNSESIFDDDAVLPDDSADEGAQNGELICGGCGTEMDGDDRFCRNCGAPTPTSQDAAEASA